MPLAGEWNTMAEGTQEKVWAHRRSKVLLLGRARGGGADCHRNLPAHEPGFSKVRVSLVQATNDEKPLTQANGDRALPVQATGGWTPLVCAKGSGIKCYIVPLP